ncbi:MAG TPA: hypothetical protein VIH28_09640 [Ignavibacteriaceae bacterium]
MPKLNRKIDSAENPDEGESVDKSTKQSASDKKPFCIATALANHSCTFETGSGKRTRYKFREGDQVAIMEEAHYLKLAHPLNKYIVPVKGIPQEDGSIKNLKKGAELINPQVSGE